MASYTVFVTWTLGIIGGGNMGAAILRGAIQKRVLEPSAVIIAELDVQRRASLASLGCAVTANPAEVAGAEQVMLAVKPQSFHAVAEAIGRLPASKVIVSIMAGLSSDVIRSALGEHARVVRAMPNTPCQAGAGMTAIALGAGAQPGDEVLARKLFESIGRCITVDETMMDAVTAVSGSGPAYVFLLAEAMEQAGHQLGLANADARVLAEQTLIGAAKLLESSGQSTSELRQAVTSPNGTTAAAIEVMFERELPQIVAEAMLAARDRGRELAATS